MTSDAQFSASGLDWYARAFEAVGWFLPPFVQLGALGKIAASIHNQGSAYSQPNLESDLGTVYRPINLAAMVAERYPKTAVLQTYSLSIGEAVEAHVLGLDHVAVAGLIPVIEGAGRQLAAQRGIGKVKVGEMFQQLIASCREQTISKSMGATDEVVSMLNSFDRYIRHFLYSGSDHYPLSDNTNRNGILHGTYRDVDFGTPLNFFKAISAVDFLTFVSTFTTSGSWMAPPPTPRSCLLAYDWLLQRGARRGASPMSPPFVQDFTELHNARPYLETLDPLEPIG